MNLQQVIALLPNLIGAISTLAVGVFAWLYWRQLGGSKAQERLNALNNDIIGAYEQRVRLLQIQVEGLQAELTAAQHTLAELRKRQVLIG